MIICFITTTTFGIIGSFTGCNLVILYKFIPTFYLLGKASMYLIFIMRLHIVYSNSIYKYNKALVISYAIFISLITIFFPIFAAINSKYHYNEIHFAENMDIVIKTCSELFALQGTIAQIFLEIINATITFTAYIIPLIKISKSLRQNFNSNVPQLKYNGTKMTILQLIASLSSWCLTIFVIITETPIGFAIDQPINIICVLLMTSYYDAWYSKCCCLCIKCFTLFDNKEAVQKDEINSKQEADKGELEFDTMTLGVLPKKLNIMM